MMTSTEMRMQCVQIWRGSDRCSKADSHSPAPVMASNTVIPTPVDARLCRLPSVQPSTLRHCALRDQGAGFAGAQAARRLRRRAACWRALRAVLGLLWLVFQHGIAALSGRAVLASSPAEPAA